MNIERIDDSNHAAAQDFYQSVGYLLQIKKTDIVITATTDSKIIGIVRLDTDKEHFVLRGMQVSKTIQRTGVGTKVLRELEKQIGDRECFCLPHDWLEGFYGQIGFKKIADEQAPHYLHERVVENRKKHPHLMVMHRPRSPIAGL